MGERRGKKKMKSNLRSCVKQVLYGPSEADHETIPECKYDLICLASVRNLSKYIPRGEIALLFLCSLLCDLELCIP